MSVIVSLEDIVGAMDLPNQEWESFLDPELGEIITVTEDDRSALEDAEPDLLPDWQRELLPKIRKAVESDSCVRLPTSFDIHEWSIMERFCHAVGDASAQGELLESIHRSGAFRAFRSTLDRLGLREQWYAYRQAGLEQIARDWLEAHRIPYK
ncbi:MAG: hypothetical protein GY733_23250 [bacterium]|nr:hypothetical protein [bacterium]